MTNDPQKVLDAALALPEGERIRIVERLLETLSADSDQLGGDDLLAELNRRRAEVETGDAQGIPWSELKRQK